MFITKLQALTVATGIFTVAVGGGVAVANELASHSSERTEFYKVTQDTDTNSIERFIIKGEGCLATEDATRLRLVDYDPSHSKVIYKCVTP